MKIELRITKGQCAGHCKIIEKPERILIGREATCDIALTDPLLSRQHCLVEITTNGIKVVDLKSRNGTYVNGQKIEETLVGFQDEVKLGRHVFQFVPIPEEAAVVETLSCSQCGIAVTSQALQAKRALRHGQYIFCEECVNKGIELPKPNTGNIAKSRAATAAIGQMQRPVATANSPTLNPNMPTIKETRNPAVAAQMAPTQGMKQPQNIGNYTVLSLLGEGGMGVVYKAEHIFLKTAVAIKVIKEELAMHSEIVERFLQEARLGISLEHKNILRIHDAGKYESMYFIAMEFFEGEDVTGLIKKNGPMSYDKLLPYAIQIADALDFAHRHKVIHRDVKPSNIMISKDMSIAKLADFGLAKAWQNAGAHQLTASGQTLGTLQYISPEQLEDSRNVTPQTDIFSLGGALCYALTGFPPFGEEPIGRVIQSILNSPPPALQDIPEDLEKIIHKAMEKKTASRYRNMGEFRDALAEFGTKSGIS